MIDMIFHSHGVEFALLTTLLILHLQVLTNSLWMHRGVAHKALTVHPILQHIFRFTMWLTSCQMVSPNWLQRYAAKHRMHHKYSDTKQDPHSPHHYTWWQLVDWTHSHIPGNANYITESDIKKFAPDVTTPNDWVEKKVYRRFPRLGTILLQVWLIHEFSLWGIIPVIAVYFNGYLGTWIINGVTHWVGYRNKDQIPTDRSHNVTPWGILMCGDELHANHHVNPSSPTTRVKWWEFDLGYVYIKIFSWIGLVKINTQIPIRQR